MHKYKMVHNIGSDTEVPLWVQEIFDILKKYYDKLQDGTHVLIIPDSFGFEVDEKLANRVIENIDNDINQHESWRIVRSDALEKLPEFSRLHLGGRKALVQELKKCLDYQRQHLNEYLEKIDNNTGYYMANAEIPNAELVEIM